jgi:hypothetical protein
LLRRSLVLVAILAVALVATSYSSAALVHIRVEGKTQTIFGGTEPRIVSTNALEALLNAARAAEFFAHVTTTSFGPYIDQIGYYPGAAQTGWVFKVNGVSPPVGADQVLLKDGDRLLWYFAQFSATGGPPTLDLRRTSPGCYRAVGQDDQGKESVPSSLVFHVGARKPVSAPAGRICPKGAHGLVWASAPGVVRSNRLP